MGGIAGGPSVPTGTETCSGRTCDGSPVSLGAAPYCGLSEDDNQNLVSMFQANCSSIRYSLTAFFPLEKYPVNACPV